MNRSLIVLALASLLVSVPAGAAEPATKAAEATKSADATKTADATKSAAITEAAKAATPAPATEHRLINPVDFKWSDAPPGLPKGAKVAVLQGDPSAPGIFAMRVTLPAGYRVMPHFHPADENVTVLSGELYMGMGDTFDETKAHAVTAGGFSTMPMGMRHFAFTKAETVFQVHGMGPWGITYVNPQDDPRNAKQAAK
jgi:quercetin dioxygenase-like cupin family protein